MVNGIGSGGSAFDIARQGLQRSSESMQSSAQDIASLATKSVGGTSVGGTPSAEASVMDVVEPMVNMKIQQNIFDASAKVISVSDDMLGSLLDIKA